MRKFLAKVPHIVSEVDEVIDLYVLVPRISPSLVEEYKSRFSTNMRTVAVNEKANITLQSHYELLNLVVGSGVDKVGKKLKKK